MTLSYHQAQVRGRAKKQMPSLWRDVRRRWQSLELIRSAKHRDSQLHDYRRFRSSAVPRIGVFFGKRLGKKQQWSAVRYEPVEFFLRLFIIIWSERSLVSRYLATPKWQWWLIIREIYEAFRGKFSPLRVIISEATGVLSFLLTPTNCMWVPPSYSEKTTDMSKKKTDANSSSKRSF